MEVKLAKIDRSNWLAAIELKVLPEQRAFVATPIFSLAAALVRRWGDEYVYASHLICDGPAAVGFVCTVCDPTTTEEYWIDDILIDEHYQGRGYGRAAMVEVIRLTRREYPRCAVVKLSCHADNQQAARLYLSIGFKATGELNSASGHPNYELAGEALRAYREA
ncbi:MAG TPA: GNAT family N-acetyltransferase [Candidatus Binataceae bacterium]|nr:GNAT family N-acetyltransferase [Candidatus Binataceae bacterium]